MDDEQLLNSIMASMGEHAGQIFTNDQIKFRWEILGISKWLHKIRSQYYGEDMANDSEDWL